MNARPLNILSMNIGGCVETDFNFDPALSGACRVRDDAINAPDQDSDRSGAGAGPLSDT